MCDLARSQAYNPIYAVQQALGLLCRRIKYLYDGQCKVCTTFKSALQVEEQDKERIDFVNIADDSFDPKQHNGISYDDAMSTIHAITLEGKTVKGGPLLAQLPTTLTTQKQNPEP